jgi:hypothetical protein
MPNGQARELRSAKKEWLTTGQASPLYQTMAGLFGSIF